jgi:hypothetical protein
MEEMRGMVEERVRRKKERGKEEESGRRRINIIRRINRLIIFQILFHLLLQISNNQV